MTTRCHRTDRPAEKGRDHRAGDDVYYGPFLAADGNLYCFQQSGQQVPDVVGQLRYDSSWGSLAVQAAGHQNRSGESFTLDGTPVIVRHDDKYGWAVGATGLIKLPFIDGGHFVVEGQYADGALDYLGAGDSVFGGYSDNYIGANSRFRTGKGTMVRRPGRSCGAAAPDLLDSGPQHRDPVRRSERSRLAHLSASSLH